MTQIRRRLGDYASSTFLTSSDVAGMEGPAVITGVAEREVKDEKQPGGSRLAIMLTFDRWPDKGYDCNVTNIRVLQDLCGEDVTPDELRGVRVWVGTHQTNFGRGILLSAPQDSMSATTAAQRQAAANARSLSMDAPPKPTLALAHSHDPAMPCQPATCDVSRAKSLGHPVDESWPVVRGPVTTEVEPFVPSHQPPVNSGASGPQVGQRFTSATPPGEYAADDPGPAAGPVAAPADEEIPF